MIKSLVRVLLNSRLNSKILVAFLLLLTVPVLTISLNQYRLSKNNTMNLAQKDVFTIVNKNNDILDAKLSRIREMIYGFMEDSDFYHIFSSLDRTDRTGILVADAKIKTILDKYFSQSQDIYSVQIVTDFFTFGTASSANSEHAKNFIPRGSFVNTSLNLAAVAGEGRLEWVPTYDFGEMYQVDYLQGMEYDYRHLFSAVALINGSNIEGKFTPFDSLSSKPVLVVNFKESLFDTVFHGSIPIQGSTYIVADEQGKIVSHPDKGLLEKPIEQDLANVIGESDSGVTTVNVDGEERVIGFARSNITGWTSIAVIPSKLLFGPFLNDFLRSMVLSVCVILLLFAVLSVFLSRIITQPIRTMIRGIVNAGEGKSVTAFEERGSYEFRVLMKKFNDMSDNIHKLIREKYEIEIREKEAEIKALNLQLDPHFMYNTLNMVSLMSLEKGETEISDIVVSLSNMMKYVVKTEAALVSFQEDFGYLQSYITIMSKRFEGAFTVSYEIDPGLTNELVPKFFLQPLVENVFVHGFRGLKRHGFLRIRCRIAGESMVCDIEDNGIGMEEGKLTSVQRQTGHIGVANVDRRIKIMFGEAYGLSVDSEAGKGTTVSVRLPFTSPERKVV
ncbi:sensor histidine kinase [Cohnella suwonensis]|uniref:Sensor histidine kinase n=1 Tax=Cohnella suwonensis TaxID=696072 RepID=A0ABW0M0G9_9BACL